MTVTIGSKMTDKRQQWVNFNFNFNFKIPKQFE